uniref:GAG-pre-integrase domain-containing protein n=1 Tax=Cajanus cajan TaxID=3821 RepID=A0A151R7V6_CAJCA|nr:hypothetical protein KK1_040107 [Cajanus cajan]
MGKTIGCGIRRGRLYYLDLTEKYSERLGQVLVTKRSQEVRKGEDIWLWHKRIGHASFGYIDKLFSNVFDQIDTLTLYCDVCELEKSHITFFFPLISNKSSFLFMIIHYDV